MLVELVSFQAFPTNTGSSNHMMRKSYLVESLLSVVFLMQEALFLFRLITFLWAKDAETSLWNSPFLAEEDPKSPCLLLSCPTRIQTKPSNGVTFLTSVVLYDRGMWGANRKHRTVPICLHKHRFLRTKCSSVIMKQYDRTYHLCMRADCLEQAHCRNRSLIWETDECQEDSDQKQVWRAHNRTGNRTARW